MIKRIIEISSEPIHLSTHHKQLVLRRKGEKKEFRTLPIEDLGLVVVDQRQTTYTHAAVVALLENGTAMLCCDDRHLPVGMLLPFATHSEVRQRLEIQIRAGLPLKKRLWKGLIQAKILGQAANLAHNASAREKLVGRAKRVRSGDPENVEAHAARAYWGSWLRHGDTFHRNAKGTDHVNLFLNYGYSVVRAALAREVVVAGLQPALGIHHRNRANPFCLADDLIEPIRPMVDRKVRDCVEENHEQLNRDSKNVLLSVLFDAVQNGESVSPLWIALRGMVSSFVACLEGGSDHLTIPEFRSETA